MLESEIGPLPRDGQGGVGLSDSATITVNVNDLDPTIDDQNLGPIDETAPDGTVVWSWSTEGQSCH